MESPPDLFLLLGLRLLGNRDILSWLITELAFFIPSSPTIYFIYFLHLYLLSFVSTFIIFTVNVIFIFFYACGFYMWFYPSVLCCPESPSVRWVAT